MKQNQKARLLLSHAAWKTILLDAHGRQEIEACGALLGHMDQQGNWHVTEAMPLRNIFASPVYFEFDPAELLTIDLEQPGRMIGVYHSHPAGPAQASSTDRQNMLRVNLEQQIPWVWLIVSGPFSRRTREIKSGGIDRLETEIIAARGLVAYHHYEDTGLQRIAVEQGGNEDNQPPQHL